jgi:hypothetical protein
VCQPWIPTGEECGLLTHTAAESVSLCAPDEKLTAFVELQAAIHRQPASSQSADGTGPQCSTQRAGASDGRLSGVSAFISAPASFPDGLPLTRAMIPWAMPEAST